MGLFGRGAQAADDVHRIVVSSYAKSAMERHFTAATQRLGRIADGLPTLTGPEATEASLAALKSDAARGVAELEAALGRAEPTELKNAIGAARDAAKQLTAAVDEVTLVPTGTVLPPAKIDVSQVRGLLEQAAAHDYGRSSRTYGHLANALDTADEISTSGGSRELVRQLRGDITAARTSWTYGGGEYASSAEHMDSGLMSLLDQAQQATGSFGRQLGERAVVRAEGTAGIELAREWVAETIEHASKLLAGAKVG